MEFLNNLSLHDIYMRPPGTEDPNLAWWVPHKNERNLLVNLSYALADSGQPLLVDAASGTGLLGRILAEAGNIKVISFDINHEAIAKLPPTLTPHQIIQADLWDMPEKLGPKLLQILSDERGELLERIRTSPSTHGGEFYTVYNKINLGYEKSFAGEVERLQQINEFGILVNSPVDLVICSFMDIERDLTTPLRDGIHPRALVYVRKVDGLAGAGDYYLEEPEDTNLKKSIISFNPGRHYKTAARWRSVCYCDWSMAKDSVLIDSAKLEAEVVVQLRSDVTLGKYPSLSIAQYSWDQELEDLMVKLGRFENYKTGVEYAGLSMFV